MATKKKQAKTLLKFHNININSYPHERLNSSRGVIKNKDLSLCSLKEIKIELKKKSKML